MAATTTSNPSKALHIALWVAQVLVGLSFASGGFMKTFFPIETLAANMTWVSAVPPAMVRFIGLSELAGGIGVILPAATRIKPFLTPLAAAGLALIMVLAAGLHASRGEYGALPINLALGALAAFVAWGRYRKAPISERRAP